MLVVELSTVFCCAVTAEIITYTSYSLKLLVHAPDEKRQPLQAS